MLDLKELHFTKFQGKMETLSFNWGKQKADHCSWILTIIIERFLLFKNREGFQKKKKKR
jgi:hypothetical protein